MSKLKCNSKQHISHIPFVCEYFLWTFFVKFHAERSHRLQSSRKKKNYHPITEKLGDEPTNAIRNNKFIHIFSIFLSYIKLGVKLLCFYYSVHILQATVDSSSILKGAATSMPKATGCAVGTFSAAETACHPGTGQTEKTQRTETNQKK